MIPTFLKPNQTYSMVSLYGVNKVKKKWEICKTGLAHYSDINVL